MSKVIQTTSGKAYAVTTQSGCNVYADEAGSQLIKTVEAGQGYFVAIGSRTWVDDDAAIVTETFNGAARKLRLLAGGVKDNLPAGYTQLEYLESTDTYAVMPISYERVDDMWFRWEQITTSNAGGQCSLILPFENGTTGFDTYIYITEGYQKVDVRIGRTHNIFDANNTEKQLIELSVDRLVVSVSGEQHSLQGDNKRTLMPKLSLFGDGAGYGLKGRIYFLEIGTGNIKVAHLVPCLDETGAPCMYDLMRHTPYYNKGRGDLIYPTPAGAASYSLRRPVAEYAKLTPHGVRRLYKLPDSYTGEAEQYIAENGFKRLVEPPKPEDGYWEPVWRETDTELVLDWREIEPPAELEN